MRRQIGKRQIRKLFKTGDSYAVTLPKDVIRKLKWQEKQKVVAELKGNIITIKDWEK